MKDRVTIIDIYCGRCKRSEMLENDTLLVVMQASHRVKQASSVDTSLVYKRCNVC